MITDVLRGSRRVLHLLRSPHAHLTRAHLQSRSRRLAPVRIGVDRHRRGGSAPRRAHALGISCPAPGNGLAAPLHRAPCRAPCRAPRCPRVRPARVPSRRGPTAPPERVVRGARAAESAQKQGALREKKKERRALFFVFLVFWFPAIAARASSAQTGPDSTGPRAPWGGDIKNPYYKKMRRDAGFRMAPVSWRDDGFVARGKMYKLAESREPQRRSAQSYGARVSSMSCPTIRPSRWSQPRKNRAAHWRARSREAWTI